MSNCWNCGGGKVRNCVICASTGTLQPYKDGTSLAYIVADGWSRGFAINQTVAEAAEMGYETTEEAVLLSWEQLTKEMEEFYLQGMGEGSGLVEEMPE